MKGNFIMASKNMNSLIMIIITAANTYIACSKVQGALPNVLWALSLLITMLTL